MLALCKNLFLIAALVNKAVFICYGKRQALTFFIREQGVLYFLNI